jgi:hypothetical protein
MFALLFMFAGDVPTTPPVTPATLEYGPAGWLAILAFLVGAAVRLLKTNAADKVLARFYIPPIPKKLVPWLALILGYAASVLEAKVRGGYPWKAAALAGFWGVLAGSTAVAGQETLSTLVRGLLGDKVASVLFGPHAGPDPGPAASSPSQRPPKAETKTQDGDAAP